MMWVMMMSQYMIRRRGRKVPYKEQTCFFLADYGPPRGVVDEDGCIIEEDLS